MSEVTCKCGAVFDCVGIVRVSEDITEGLDEVEFGVICPSCGATACSEGYKSDYVK